MGYRLHRKPSLVSSAPVSLPRAKGQGQCLFRAWGKGLSEWSLLFCLYSFSNNHLCEENIELLMGALQGTCRLKRLQ